MSQNPWAPLDPTVLFEGLDKALEALREAGQNDLSQASMEKIRMGIELVEGSKAEIQSRLPDFLASVESDRQTTQSCLSRIEALKGDIAAKRQEVKLMLDGSRAKADGPGQEWATSGRAVISAEDNDPAPQTVPAGMSAGEDLVGWLLGETKKAVKPERQKIANIWESWNPNHQLSPEELQDFHHFLDHPDGENPLASEPGG